MTDIKKGDRVRVTFDGVADADNSTYRVVKTDNHEWALEYRKDRGVQIEKIEPPVEVFKPGDVVRRKKDGALIALTDRGYSYLDDDGQTWDYGFLYHTRLVCFTSKDYEKVNIE